MEQPSILERLRAFNRWTKGWAASIAVAVGIWIVLRSYLIEAFRIPSASMENTLLVGDFLFVNKAIYGGELEIPLTGIRCCRLPGYAEPRRDGIVVFRSVEDSTPNLNIVKRVIGGPTDTLQMTHDTVYRNGKRLDEPYALHLGPHPDDPLQLRKIRALHLPYYVGRDTAHYHPTTHDWGPIAIIRRPTIGARSRSHPGITGSWATTATNPMTAASGDSCRGRTSWASRSLFI